MRQRTRWSGFAEGTPRTGESARLAVALIAAFFVHALAFAPGASSGAAETQDPDIVVLKNNADPKKVAAEHRKQYGVAAEYIYRYALKGYAARLSATQISALEGDRSVLFVDHRDDDIEVPPEPLLRQARDAQPEQPPQALSLSLDRIDADLSSTISGDGRGRVPINVAVLDGGIQPDHPDLNVVGGTNCLGSGKKNDFADQDGHGTMVGGLIGALDNQIGRVGVAPGARLFAIRVADPDGHVTDAALLCGVDWATSTLADGNSHNDIAVANMSLGGFAPRDDERCGRTFGDADHFAICGLTDAGVISVVSAGNDEIDLSQQAPATYSEVLTAAAMGDRDGVPGGLGGQFSCEPDQFDDRFAFFSNFATLASDQAHVVAAPGVCIGSTFIDSQYAVGSGTSFSSPVATGAIALCIASGPCAGRNPKAIIRKIVADAGAYNQSHPDYGYEGDPFRPIPDRFYGWLIRPALY